MQIKRLLALASFAFTSTVVAQGALAQAVQVDAGLPAYKTAPGKSGNFTSVGADTLNNLMPLWAEEFKRFDPNVNIQIQGAGSSTAPPALIKGAANFGPMSRAMNSTEIEAFEKRFGYKPTAVPVAIDALAVYVNKENPIKGLSIPQVDAIFSATRRCGGKADVTQWGQLSLAGDWATRAVALYGRNSVSGTYGYFKEVALCRGDFKRQVAEQPGSASVVQSVTTQLNAIGYAIERWFPVRDADDVERLTRIRAFSPMLGNPTVIAPDYFRKGFLVADDKGNVAIYSATARRTMATARVSDTPIVLAAVTPRANA
jgi:phosphate transport system substrate-binding protein